MCRQARPRTKVRPLPLPECLRLTRLWLRLCCLGLLWLGGAYHGQVTAAQLLECVDDSQKKIQLARPAKRIITLAPHATEWLFSLGVGERIIATVSFSDYPPAAKMIPRLGGYTNLSAEKIYALAPDLVVAWQGGNSPQLLQQLEALGIVVYRSSAQSIIDIKRNLSNLARLTAVPAEPVLAKFEQALAGLTPVAANQPEVTVFYQLWSDPLMSANDSLLVSRMLRFCGARNIFGARPETVPRIQHESVLKENPDMILAPRQGTPDNWRARWQQWPFLKAVRAGHLYQMDADLLSRATVRVAEGMRQICLLVDTVRREKQQAASITKAGPPTVAGQPDAEN